MSDFSMIPPSQMASEKAYLLSAIFKLLPYRQEHYEYLDSYFESVLQRLLGFNEVSGYCPEIVTVISLVEYARHEDDFKKYRKAILDDCGIMQLIKEGCDDV